MFHKMQLKSLVPLTDLHPDLQIKLYQSAESGLSMILVDLPSCPLVNGFFAVATEAMDDDGCPHTLEHLVFLGSEDYPYKGVLDSLANRALAQGTNAWTDVDHTCYTITTGTLFRRSPAYNVCELLF
jgi:Zn-dependent M16 (insulinase) family peptidase